MTKLIRLCAAILWALLGGTCHACMVAGLVLPVFFEKPPMNIDASVIAKIRVTEILSQPQTPYRGGRYVRYGVYVAVASVEHVFKGQLDGDFVRIVASGSTCDDQLQTGSRGIVAGNLEADNQAGVALVLISETYVQRRLRESNRKKR